MTFASHPCDSAFAVRRHIYRLRVMLWSHQRMHGGHRWKHVCLSILISSMVDMFPIVLAKRGQAERSWTFREQGQHQRQARVDSLTQSRDIQSQLLQTKHSLRLRCFTRRSITSFCGCRFRKHAGWQTIKPLC